jgi:hypothetical protein
MTRKRYRQMSDLYISIKEGAKAPKSQLYYRGIDNLISLVNLKRN